MKKLFALLSIIVVATIFMVSSCKKNDGAPGKIEIILIDTAGPYQEVNVEILKVSVHMVPNNGNASWIDLPTNSGIYDLLKLQNGIDTTLVDPTPLTSGKITQMRLLLGNNNTVKVNNVTYVLTVPSGKETGIKIIGQIVVNPNQTLSVILDFDANASIVYTGNNNYQLKPTIKVL